MDIQFDPNNNIIKLCLLGMGMEENGRPEDAGTLFHKAWSDAANDFERFISAYFLARSQENIVDKLKGLESALQFAMEADNDVLKSAFPALYSAIAQCHEGLGDFAKAKEFYEMSDKFKLKPFDKGPFYHGTKADLQVGDLLTAGGTSNYRPEFKMNHIYFTALVNGAGLAAALAKGEGRERVYIVEPTGDFENDPNVTDKKFPGNLTRSYRSQEPLRIVGEVKEWVRQTPEELLHWRERLANSTGEIIN